MPQRWLFIFSSRARQISSQVGIESKADCMVFISSGTGIPCGQICSHWPQPIQSSGRLSFLMVSMAMLIVCGVMIGYICSAITELIVTFASDADIVNLHNWSRGSFSGMTWDNVKVMAVVVFVCFIAVFLLSKPLDAYNLGESFAAGMGVSVKALRVFIVLLSSLLSGCIVAFAGPISFVGIAAPHIIRKMFHTEKPIVMIPACFLGGSLFCLVCDLIARNLFAPTELNISTVTAVFGAPVVILIMAGRRNKKGV